jgi:hypothetical protein
MPLTGGRCGVAYEERLVHATENRAHGALDDARIVRRDEWNGVFGTRTNGDAEISRHGREGRGVTVFTL